MPESTPGDITEFCNNAWQTATRFAGVHMSTCEKLARAQNDFMMQWAEYGTKQMQMLDGRHDAGEIMSSQSALVAEYSSKLFEHASRMFAIVTEANKELMTCFEPQGAKDTGGEVGGEVGRARRSGIGP